MLTSNQTKNHQELPVTTTGETTDQLEPKDDLNGENDLNGDEIDLNSIHSDFDDEPLDNDEDLDDDEVSRLFPGKDSSSEIDYDDDNEAEEPYEGIRHGGDEDEGLVDDNMSGMPVIPSPS